jgi:hypothetical protein
MAGHHAQDATKKQRTADDNRMPVTPAGEVVLIPEDAPPPSRPRPIHPRRPAPRVPTNEQRISPKVDSSKLGDK